MKPFAAAFLLQHFSRYLAAAVFLASGCSADAVLKKAGVKKPTAAVRNVSVNRLDFAGIGLAFDVEVENPNPVGVSLAGLDYKLLVQDQRLLSGNMEQRLHIAARGNSRLAIPVELKFRDLLAVFSAKQELAETDYTLELLLKVEVPVLGTVQVPLRAGGRIPVLRRPAIRLQRLQVHKFGFTGVELLAKLRIQNPNFVALTVRKLAYRLALGGTHAADGEVQEPLQIAKAGESQIEIPIHLSFSGLASGAVQVLRSGSTLDYRIQGKVDGQVEYNKSFPVAFSFDHQDRVAVKR